MYSMYQSVATSVPLNGVAEPSIRYYATRYFFIIIFIIFISYFIVIINPFL